jgi:RimJ/RimL family protein N-acetyltransferase
MIVGVTGGHPRGMVLDISADAIDWQFSEWPEAGAGIADPDVRNIPMRVLCMRLGMTQVDIVQLPYKTARFMAVTRSDWIANRDRVDAQIAELC